MAINKVAFRVDASEQIGSGHFMRCLTLADQLRKNDARILFVSRHLPAYFQEMLLARQYDFAYIGGENGQLEPKPLFHSPWLGTSQEHDANATIKVLAGASWDWLVVDHYALGVHWELAIRTMTNRILAIDDIADRAHDCDLLLDQNFYEDMAARYANKVPARCQMLLGPGYAMLRDEFQMLRSGIKPRKGPVKRVFVFFGGMDHVDCTSRALSALAANCKGEVSVDVVIGKQHSRSQHIEQTCAKFGFACHIQTNKMAELMASADLAIGAGGSTIWERCCLGLPVLAFPIAENQVKQLSDAASAGLVYMPDTKDDLVAALNRHLSALIDNGHLRHFLSKNGMQTVDGHGASHVVERMQICGN